MLKEEMSRQFFASKSEAFIFYDTQEQLARTG